MDGPYVEIAKHIFYLKDSNPDKKQTLIVA